MAYMVPLLARLRPATPRQVLLVVPSRELALQSLEVGQELADEPGLVGLLAPGKDPAARLLRSEAAFLVATSTQLRALQPDLTRADSRLLRGLRATLQAVVVDEVDAVLRPAGRGGMQNRARRDESLRKLPVARALSALLERRADAASPRLQLLVASATMSKRVMRDVATVVGSRPGKVGLAVPLAVESRGAIAARPDARASAASPAPPEGDLRAVNDLGGEWGGEWAAGGEAGAPSVRPGRGERGGVCHVGVPRGITHMQLLCSEREKGAAIAALLDRADAAWGGGAGGALLVVRDGLDLREVVRELSACGVESAAPLAAVVDAAARHHRRHGPEATGAHPAEPAPAWATGASGNAGAAESAAATADEEQTGQEAEAEEHDAWTLVEEAAALAPSGAGASGQAGLEAARMRQGVRQWPLLVAHESSLRGLDLPHVRLVMLTSVPGTAEAYIHIAGRTGRAGAHGRSVCIFTRGEMARAGVITRALQGVPWEMARWDGAAKEVLAAG